MFISLQLTCWINEATWSSWHVTKITQGLCALDFVLIHNDPILSSKSQCSGCSNSSIMYKMQWSDPIKYRHPQEQGQNSSPYHDRPPNLTPHISTMTSFTNCNVYLHQWRPISSPMLGHITLKDHIIIKSSLRGLQWDFCWNPQETSEDLGFKNSF